MKTSISIFLLTALCYLPGRAQNEINDYVSLNEQLQIIGSKESDSKGYVGSPYWEDEFIPGSVVQGDGKALDVYFRYNVLGDQVEIKVEEDQEEIFVLPRSKEVSFRTDQYTYKLKNYQTENGDLLTGYLLSYFEGDTLIFVGKPKAKVSAAQKPETSYDRPKPATVRIRSHYYLGVGDKPLIEVRLREKDFRKILEDGNGMKEYFKEHKVDDIKVIVEMLKFYEENN